jgi:hypothetical protein
MKLEDLCNVLMKYGINIINIRLVTQQVGWLGGEGVELCCGPRIKTHN